MSQSDTHPIAFAGRDKRLLIKFLLLAAIVLATDLISKSLAFRYVAGQPVIVNHDTVHDPHLIPFHDDVTIIPSVLSLKLTINHGAVFGLGAGGRWVFIVVTILAMGMITMIFWRSDRSHRLMHTALSLILAGAVGNLYDRMFCGAVRDLLHLFPGVKLPFGWSWPGGGRELYPWIFNIADVALVIGVALMLLTLLRPPKASSA